MSSERSNHEMNLRERQQAATREEIITTALQLVERDGDAVSHEAIARQAGMSARTVYRYFPDRTTLMQALWDRARKVMNIRFPETKDEIIPFARAAFESLDKHAQMVRPVMAYVILSLDKQSMSASMQRSVDAFSKALEGLLEDVEPKQRKVIVGTFAALYSSPFWHLLRDRAGLTGPEAQEAVVWTMQMLLDSLGKADKKKKEKKKK